MQFSCRGEKIKFNVLLMKNLPSRYVHLIVNATRFIKANYNIFEIEYNTTWRVISDIFIVCLLKYIDIFQWNLQTGKICSLLF